MIIGEVMLHTRPSPQEFSQNSISTSDRNRQNRSRKWRYSSLGGPGQYLRSWKNGEQGNMIVDTRLKIGIREENIQVDLGKQLNGTRLPLAMSPTYLQCKLTFNPDDYGKKASIKRA